MLEAEFHMRIVFPEFRHDRRDQMRSQTMRKSDTDLTAFRVEKFMHLRHRTLQLFEHRFHPFAKELPHWCQLQVTPLLHEQVDTKLLLQLMNLAAYCGLCNMQFLRSSCYMFLLSNL
ncbi:hypothetical protein D3C74_375340 [compost metagenome]